MPEFIKKENGVRIVSYQPNSKERLLNMVQAMESKRRMEQKAKEQKAKNSRTVEEVLEELREILEITERTSLLEKREATGCDY